MPITTKHGSIFDTSADVIVIPVNCVGVMGKGLALEARNRFDPEIAQLYNFECSGGLRPGDAKQLNGGYVYIVATKEHWRDPSRLSWVNTCLGNLVHQIDLHQLDSIAVPQLGCGCGGLDWAEVEPLIHKHLGGLDCNVEVWIYEQ